MFSCVMFYRRWHNMGLIFIYHTPCRVSSQYNLPRDFLHSECRGDLTVYSTSSRIVQRTLDWGRRREWSFALFTVLDVGNPSYWDALLPFFVEVMADRVASVAFPAEGAAEMHDEKGSTLDDPGNDAVQVPLDEDLSIVRKIFWMPCRCLVLLLMKQSADVLGLHYH